MTETIIHKLLDKYENSKLSKEGSTLNLKIEIKPQAIKKTYGKSTATQLTLKLNENVAYLELQNLIYTNKPGITITSIGLNLERLDEAYKFVKRTPKRVYEEKCIKYLDTLNTPTSNYLKTKLKNYESVARYFDIKNIKDLKDLLKLSDFILENKEYISYRKASQKLFGDTKRLESIINRTLTLIQDVYQKDKEEIEFNSKLEKNPDFIYIKGTGTFQINKQTIDITQIDGGIGFHSKTINNLKCISQDIQEVYSIENLTSYHYFEKDNALIIYLGGYHNTLKETFFKEIYTQNKNTNYYHFGDIDPDGIEIYLNLINKTNIPFKMYKMDSETLLTNKQYTKPLEKTNINKINHLKKRANLKVLDTMLEHNIKLEQEIIE